MGKTKWLAAAALAFAAQAGAAPNAVVEAVQYPAWLERGGATVPLTPGTELRASDRLRTGDKARVRMKLGEGSTVKLGERANFALERAEPGNVFRASLAVVTGAFRFTTDALNKAGLREVDIRVRDVTAGVRGTDLWGRSNDEGDLVCLLEGRIQVGSVGYPSVTLDTPLDFYQRKRDAGPSVSKVDPAKVEEWARETEMEPNGAVGSIGGRWRVVAATVGDRDAAQEIHRELRAKGYPAEVAGPERGQFVVEVPGLAGEAEARALAISIRAIRGVSLPTIHPAR
jgi:hypothetical protein